MDSVPPWNRVVNVRTVFPACLQHVTLQTAHATVQTPSLHLNLIKTCSVSCKRPCIKLMHITCVPVKKQIRVTCTRGTINRIQYITPVENPYGRYTSVGSEKKSDFCVSFLNGTRELAVPYFIGDNATRGRFALKVVAKSAMLDTVWLDIDRRNIRRENRLPRSF